ncbi:MAG: hypothetical protein KF760_27700 [Candidatus Eremiobacteraeota bacterium]|nr:hypothetical protein [Candidatus Eremiobacteraeota bacterium]MCW5872556.1 hypothetical protein [Candidatus Eremiobacteraeota bacterium]
MRMTEFGRRIFPWRGYLGVPFLLTMLWICAPDPRLPAGPGWFCLGFGLALRLWGVAGWVPRRLAADAPERLIEQDGPYVYTRNPRYLGNLLLGLGGCQIAGLKMCLLPYAILWAAIHFPIIAYEEELLQQRYGLQYAEYCRRVPRFCGLTSHPLRPQVWPLRWELAYCLEMSTIAGWFALGVFLQCWRWIQLGASPSLYYASFVVGALGWIALSGTAKFLRRKTTVVE